MEDRNPERSDEDKEDEEGQMGGEKERKGLKEGRSDLLSSPPSLLLRQ